jgi:hypothetical protein
MSSALHVTGIHLDTGIAAGEKTANSMGQMGQSHINAYFVSQGSHGLTTPQSSKQFPFAL